MRVFVPFPIATLTKRLSDCARLTAHAAAVLTHSLVKRGVWLAADKSSRNVCKTSADTDEGGCNLHGCIAFIKCFVYESIVLTKQVF